VYRVGETDADNPRRPGLPEAVGHVALRLVGPRLGDAHRRRECALAAGSNMSLTAMPTTAAARCNGVWEQTSKNVIALAGVTLMRFVGPRFLSTYYKKVYDGLGVSKLRRLKRIP